MEWRGVEGARENRQKKGCTLNAHEITAKINGINAVAQTRNGGWVKLGRKYVKEDFEAY